MGLFSEKPDQIYGGIVTKSGTAVANLARRLVRGLKSDEFFYFFKFMIPTVVCGMKESTTTDNDQVTAISVVTDSNGNNRLAISSDDTVLTPAAPAAASVGVASAVILAASSARKKVIGTSTTAATISISLGANAAVLNSGLTLTAIGSTFVLEGKEAELEVRGIASAAASNLSLQVIN
jgi:hypothetical protein